MSRRRARGAALLPQLLRGRGLHGGLGLGYTKPKPRIEHLAAAEARGALCRDDGPEGLRFFRNFFADADCTVG